MCCMTLFLNDKVINHDNILLTFWWPGEAPSFISASTKPSSSNVTNSPLSASFHFGEVTLWTSLIATDLCTVLVFAQYIPTWKASCKWKMTDYHLLIIRYTSTRVKHSFQYEVYLISSFSPSDFFFMWYKDRWNHNMDMGSSQWNQDHSLHWDVLTGRLFVY